VDKLLEAGPKSEDERRYHIGMEFIGSDIIGSMDREDLEADIHCTFCSIGLGVLSHDDLGRNSESPYMTEWEEYLKKLLLCLKMTI
jgi:hypothetical protein